MQADGHLPWPAARQAAVQLQLARLQNAVQLYCVLGGGAPPATPMR